jgi:hypothetical protein
MRLRVLVVSSLLVGVSACESDAGSGEAVSSTPDPSVSASSEPSATVGDNDDSEAAASVAGTSEPESTPPLEPDDEFAPDPASLPDAEAPYGLDGTVLPDDAAGAAELFAALPDEFHGVQREISVRGPGEVAADYQSDDRACGPTGFQALDLSAVQADGFYPEGSTAEDVVAVFATGADWEVDGAGHDDDLFWVMWQTTCSGEGIDGVEQIHSATWGEAGSSLVFFAGAPEAGTLDELMAVFVDAATEQAAAPDAPPPTADEAAAQAALLTAEDLGPEWFSQPLIPEEDDPEADAAALDIMNADPACTAAAEWAELEGVSLNDFGKAVIPDAPVDAEGPTLTYRPDGASSVEHTVLVFETADEVAEAFRLSDELRWSDCLQAVFDDLMQLQFDENGFSLTDYTATETSADLGDEGVTLTFGMSVQAPGDSSSVDMTMATSYVRVGRAITIIFQFSIAGAIDGTMDDTVAKAVDKVTQHFG